MKGLLLSFLSIVFSTGLCSQTITGNVYNKGNGAPLKRVSVNLYQRVVDTLPDGTLNLQPIANAKQVAQMQTGESGTFKFDQNLQYNSYYYAKFTAPGFEEMLYTLIRPNPEQSANIEIMMPPSLPTSGELRYMEKLEDSRLRINNNAKAEEWSRINMLQRALPESANRQQQAACTYTVPSTFYVKNLSAGYNSYSCPASGTFTGNMPQDEYIGGCVAGEMGGSFPLEAQKTQAVCARTYALKRQNAGSGANCGQAYSFTVCASCTTASTATTNQVMTYNGNLIEALYAARCNGSYTETASPGGCNAFTTFPYLVCTTCSGHTDCQTAGEPCTSCTNACTNTASKVYGHGVGMCQRGSQGFAQTGQSYTWILNHFYNNICLANTTSPAPANDNCNSAIQLNSNSSCANTLSTVNDATADNIAVPSCDLYTPAANVLGAGVFFKFTAVSTSHTIKVSPTGNLDAILVLYKGSSCTSLQEVACIDQSGGAGVITTLTVNNLTISEQYWIRVYDYGSANTTNGGFNICVTHVPCTSPSAATSISSTSSTYCNSQSPITLTAVGTLTTGAIWKWYSGSCSGNAIDTGVSIQVSPGANTTYFVRAESSCGKSACVSKQITVTQPAPAPVILALGSTVLCSNQSVRLAVSNACVGCTYIWNTGSNNDTITADTTAIFYVTQNSSCGGFQQSNTINIVKSSPVAIATASPASVTSGTPGNIEGSGGISCSWSIAGGSSFSSSCTTSVSPSQTTIYNLLITDANGCTATTQTVLSVVPVGCSYAVNPTSIVTDSNGTTTTVQVTTSGNNCTWQAIGSGCGFVTLQNPSGNGNGSFTVIIPPTTDTVTQNCILNVNGQLLTVVQSGKKPKPSTPGCSIDTSLTLYGNCKLTAKNITGATYKWFKDGVEINGAGNRIYDADENAVYNVVITKGNCAAIGSDWYLNCLPLSLPFMDATYISVFPNPNEGLFTIAASLSYRIQPMVTIIDNLGQKVYEQLLPATTEINHQIELNHLNTGIYIIQIKAGTNVVSKKLLIQR